MSAVGEMYCYGKKDDPIEVIEECEGRFHEKYGYYPEYVELREGSIDDDYGIDLPIRFRSNIPTQHFLLGPVIHSDFIDRDPVIAPEERSPVV